MKKLKITIRGQYKTPNCWRKINIKTNDVGMAKNILSVIREYSKNISKNQKKIKPIWAGVVEYKMDDKAMEEQAIQEGTKKILKKVQKGFKLPKFVPAELNDEQLKPKPLKNGKPKNRNGGYKKINGSKGWSVKETMVIIDAINNGHSWLTIFKNKALPDRTDNSLRARFSVIKNRRYNQMSPETRKLIKKHLKN